MEQETVEINGEKIVFFVQRKKIKNINLKVNVDGKIIISMPMKMKLDRAKGFIRLKINWIKKYQDFYGKFAKRKESSNFNNGEELYLLGKAYEIKLYKGKNNEIKLNDKYIEIQIKENYINDTKYIKQYYNKWLKQYSLNIIEGIVKGYQNKLKEYEIKLPKIEIRKMKSRWGSCYFLKNKIVFSLNIIKTPIPCIEYVVLHELSHFRYHNHSKNFYNFIAIFMPDWKERGKILNEEYQVESEVENYE